MRDRFRWRLSQCASMQRARYGSFDNPPVFQVIYGPPDTCLSGFSAYSQKRKGVNIPLTSARRDPTQTAAPTDETQIHSSRGVT